MSNLKLINKEGKPSLSKLQQPEVGVRLKWDEGKECEVGCKINVDDEDQVVFTFWCVDAVELKAYKKYVETLSEIMCDEFSKKHLKPRSAYTDEEYAETTKQLQASVWEQMVARDEMEALKAAVEPFGFCFGPHTMSSMNISGVTFSEVGCVFTARQILPWTAGAIRTITDSTDFANDKSEKFEVALFFVKKLFDEADMIKKSEPSVGLLQKPFTLGLSGAAAVGPAVGPGIVLTWDKGQKHQIRCEMSVNDQDDDVNMKFVFSDGLKERARVEEAVGRMPIGLKRLAEAQISRVDNGEECTPEEFKLFKKRLTVSVVAHQEVAKDLKPLEAQVPVELHEHLRAKASEALCAVMEAAAEAETEAEAEAEAEAGTTPSKEGPSGGGAAGGAGV